jgi:hypothetical protein
VCSLNYSLLLLARKLTGPEPPFGLCVFQGAVVLASAPIQAAAALCLVSHAYHVLLALYRQKAAVGRFEKVSKIALLAVPWVLFTTLTLVCLIVGTTSNAGRASVKRETFYCLVSLDWLATLSSVCTGIFAVAAVLLVCGLGILLFLLRRRENTVLGTTKAVDVSFAIRCSIFGAYLLVASSFAVAYADDFAAIVPECVCRSRPPTRTDPFIQPLHLHGRRSRLRPLWTPVRCS